MKRVYALLILMCFAPVAHGEEVSSQENNVQLESKEAEQEQTPHYSFFTDTKNLLTLGLGLGAAAYLYKYDQKIYDEFIEDDHHLPAQKTMLAFSRNYGRTAFMVPMLATIWFGSLTVPDSQLAYTTQNAIKSFLLSGAIVAFLKVTAHRMRPNTGSKAHNFNGPDYLDYDNGSLSFPSGDAQTAWSILSSFALAFGESTIWAPIGCYTVASFVTFGRIYDKAHWPSDAFMGSLIGFMTAYNVYHYSSDSREEIKRLEIQPTVLQEKFLGLSLSYRY